LSLSSDLIKKLVQKKILLNELETPDLVKFCELANQTYRMGECIISDEDYDFVYLKELKKRLPNHALLQQVEPEGLEFSSEKIRLPESMLSTDKAYSWQAVDKWLSRIKKSSIDINLKESDIILKSSAKLDGFAGYDDGKILYTRGDGKKGSDISRVFDRGLQVFNHSKRGQGAGEIVVKKSYFTKYLADSFEYPRNFQASLIKEKILDTKAQLAIDKGAALFVPFAQLTGWQGSISELEERFDEIIISTLKGIDFEVDGVVFEVVNAPLKVHMGANRKFHRWQIAFKENKDKAQVRVLSVTPQVGRTGKITPVAELEPTLLSGATIMRATGHHYALVREQGLGAGSVIELTRSGLVIPKINRVLKPAKVQIPKTCPSCLGELTWESDFLMCLNHQNCPAQIIGKMEYFFKILGNNDGFGSKTIEKFYHNGICTLSQIYDLTQQRLEEMSFGQKTAENLMAQLEKSRSIQIEDWRFLAAFGVMRLGKGNAENLLKFIPLNEIMHLNVDKIANIEGFAQLSSEAIVNGLSHIKIEFEHLFALGFNLEVTQVKLQVYTHDLAGKKIIFTGKMHHNRDEMKKHAKSMGIVVVSSVNRQTNFLVIGENVGVKKITDAEKFGVKILTEQAYLEKF
jgi:DNA ligase (NAD+)